MFAQNIDCGYTLEPPRRDGSNEYPQSIFWIKNKTKLYTPVYPSFSIKSGVKVGTHSTDMFFWYLDFRHSGLRLSRIMGKSKMRFPKRSDTNRGVQAQTMAGDWKFWILKNRGIVSVYVVAKTMALISFAVCEADLRLCFRICETWIFS